VPYCYTTNATITYDYDPWSPWNSTLCTTAATNTYGAGNTTATTATAVWHVWNQYYTPTSSYGTGDPWIAWNTGTGNRPLRVRDCVPPPVMTPEQLEAQQRQRREHEARIAADRRAREEAEVRAEQLLLRELDEGQRAEYLRDKAFTVRLPDGKRYRIKKGWAGNVERVEDVRLPQQQSPSLVANDQHYVAVEKLCIHPNDWVPDQDNMLAQKLLLEADEAKFRRIANITRLRA
jgi:hypothetical protein